MGKFRKVLRWFLSAGTFVAVVTGCGSGFQAESEQSSSKRLFSTPPSGDTESEALYAYIRDLSPLYVGIGTIEETGQKKFPSMVLGVVTPRGSSIMGFGLTPKGTPPTAKDIYPLSSISKMLTGLILARGVHEGLYVLARPLKDTLPADLAAGVTTETLGMTVAHHASFRPMPTNLDYSNMDSPGAGYTRAQLTTCLKNRECSRTAAPIGSTYLYSNLGIGILGQALVNIHKKASFEELLRDRLTAELEMDDTSADLKHYKSGYTVVGGFRATGDGAVGPATMGALVAAGGVLSSGEDMMKLMSQVVHPSGRWTGIMETATTPIMPGHALAIDIRTREGMELFSKGGEQAGYSSLIIWNKQTGSGVFALANRGMQSESLAKFLIKIHARIAQGL